MAKRRKEKPKSSPRKRRANRDNSKKSTGPRSDRGKEIVARNAIQHGLDARDVIIRELGESRRDFNELLAACAAHFEPRDAYERDLVAELAEVRWLIRRVRRYRQNTTRHVLDDAERLAIQAAARRGDLDARAERIVECGDLPDSRQLAKADKHVARLQRRQRMLVDELCGARGGGGGGAARLSVTIQELNLAVDGVSATPVKTKPTRKRVESTAHRREQAALPKPPEVVEIPQERERDRARREREEG